MTELRIEARLLRILSGHYFASATLRGCQLVPLEQRSNVVDRQKYEFYLTGYACLTPYTILTYWTNMGIFAEKDEPEFWIIQTVPGAVESEVGYDQRWHFGIKGPLDVLAYAKNDAVTQLYNWWNGWAPKNGGQNEFIARWLGAHTGRLPIGEEPPAYLHRIVDSSVKNPPFLSMEAWKFDLPQ
jgi:hypothetical protein